MEATGNRYPLLDMTVYGRQETWEDSPADQGGIIVCKGDSACTDCGLKLTVGSVSTEIFAYEAATGNRPESHP